MRQYFTYRRKPDYPPRCWSCQIMYQRWALARFRVDSCASRLVGFQGGSRRTSAVKRDVAFTDWPVAYGRAILDLEIKTYIIFILM